MPPSYHLFTHAGSLILHKRVSVSDSEELLMSHAFDFIYLKTDPCCCASTRAANTCCFVQTQSLKTLRSSHFPTMESIFPTYHVSAFWIMSSTRLPPLPTLSTVSLPSPLQSPLINIFHIVNHLCQLLVIIDN